MSELEDALIQARRDAWDKIVAWADTRPSGIMSVPRKEKADVALARLERLVRLDGRRIEHGIMLNQPASGCRTCKLQAEIAEAVK